MTAPTSVVQERLRLDIEEAKKHVEIPDPPVCRLYGWRKCGSYPGYLYGEYVENHPHLGNGRDVYTTAITYFNRECGIAATRNTVYVLVGPEKRI